MITMMLSDVCKATSGVLKGQDITFKGCNTDSRQIESGQLFIALKGEHFDGHDYLSNVAMAGAAAALVEREIEVDMPIIVVADVRKAMGDLASAWRGNFKLPVAAVTGSNGKTTVKEMLASILSVNHQVLVTQGNLNNDIGVPLTLYGIDDVHQFAVIEMGANHEGEINNLSRMTSPDVAVITQCAPAHLEGFGSIEGVARAKSEIFNGLSESGTAIINADDNYADFWHQRASRNQQMTFGLNKAADVTANDIDAESHIGCISFKVEARGVSTPVFLKLAGVHNVMNALAATACALALNIDMADIKKGLESMQAVKGRLQVKEGSNQSLLIDDTYNANPESLQAAIKVLAAQNKVTTLVLGDMAELGDEAESMHADAGRLASESKLDRLYALGSLSLNAVKQFNGDAQHFDNVESLVQTLIPKLTVNDVVLIKGSRSMHMERVVEALLAGERQAC